MSASGRAGDALTAAGRIRASTDRVRDSVGAALGGEAVLAMPGHQPRTREQREEEERVTAEQDRAASIGAVSWAIQLSGCGGPGQDWEPSAAWAEAHPGVPAASVPRCRSPLHPAHRHVALEFLRELRLVEDPESGACTTDLGIRKQASKKGKAAGPA